MIKKVVTFFATLLMALIAQAQTQTITMESDSAVIAKSGDEYIEVKAMLADGRFFLIMDAKGKTLCITQYKVHGMIAINDGTNIQAYHALKNNCNAHLVVQISPQNVRKIAKHDLKFVMVKGVSGALGVNASVSEDNIKKFAQRVIKEYYAFTGDFSSLDCESIVEPDGEYPKKMIQNAESITLHKNGRLFYLSIDADKPAMGCAIDVVIDGKNVGCGKDGYIRIYFENGKKKYLPNLAKYNCKGVMINKPSLGLRKHFTNSKVVKIEIKFANIDETFELDNYTQNQIAAFWHCWAEHFDK